MKKYELSDLTPEIESRIPAFKAKCMDLTGTKESSVKYIHKIYEMAGEKKPLVFFAKNPNEYKILFELIPSILKLNNTSHDASLGASLYDSLCAPLDASLGDSLRDSLYASLGDSLDASLGASLRDELNKDKQRSSWAWYCSAYSRVYFTWYKFIQDSFNIDHKYRSDVDELYELICDSAISRCWFTKAYVLVLENPTSVHFNENNQLHNVNGAAYDFNGECSSYNICNVKLEKAVFDSVSTKTITPEQFFMIANEEEKSAILAMMQELHGDTFVFDFFSEVMTETDSYVDKKKPEHMEGTTKGMNIGVYTLFKGQINDATIAYVRCYCPSTDRMFFLGVEPKYETAKDAIASLYRVPTKLRNHIKYIQRQGERFSTVFNEEGNKILRGLNEEQIRNTTTITGNEYFSLMQYEY